jgi:uncharacterized protein YcaQ
MTKTVASISTTVRRRFILGLQGLWPGRRWAGKDGTEQALRCIEAVQVDPVSVIAQSHDIVLWGRVADYQPQFLTSLAYEERKFFDYGAWLMIYPMDELPYWRTKMQRRKKDQRWTEFAADNSTLLEDVKQQLRQRGPLRNRDLDGKKVTHYRSGKDTGVALYNLWLTGELMTHHRHGKERVYDFLDNVAPAHLLHSISQKESEEYLLKKAIAHYGLIDARSFRAAWKNIRENPLNIKEAESKLAAMVESGQITALQLEDAGETVYCLADDYPLLETLQRGDTPQSWLPLETSTLEEITFLSPLEFVSARRRAKKLFAFDYIWEIYKPATIRKYGPYTMPILYGDQLVARMDAKLDRPNQTLIINGFWLETWFKPNDNFAIALASGLARFTKFLGAERLNTTMLKPNFLRQRVDRIF